MNEEYCQRLYSVYLGGGKKCFKIVLYCITENSKAIVHFEHCTLWCMNYISIKSKKNISQYVFIKT